MKTNEGTFGRALRIAVGILLLVLTLTHIIGAWGWIGVLPLITGIVGWCPLYALLGFNTYAVKVD